MKLMGHKTREIFRRHEISDNKDLHDSTPKLTGMISMEVKPRVKHAQIVGVPTRKIG